MYDECEKFIRIYLYSMTGMAFTCFALYILSAYYRVTLLVYNIPADELLRLSTYWLGSLKNVLAYFWYIAGACRGCCLVIYNRSHFSGDRYGYNWSVLGYQENVYRIKAMSEEVG